MEKRTIDTISTRKLWMLMLVLLTGLIICFMTGGILAPSQYHSEQLLASKCYDKDGLKDEQNNQWFYPRGKGACRTIYNIIDNAEDFELSSENVVYSFQMPLPRYRIELDYSRNKGDSEDEWKEYASSLDNRSVHCKMDRNLPFYNCSTQRLFDLGSLYHDYYLLNIRILDVMCPSSNNRSELIISKDFGKFVDLWLVTNIQNGGFTMLWLSLKSMFFLVISLAVIYYWKKVSSSGRPSHLLEKKLMVLSCSLILLNFPLEYFTLAFNLPWIYLFINFFQVIFYVNLLFFLFLFTAEAKAQDFLGYWKKSLTIAMIGCISIIIMDAMVGKAVVQSVNPFYASSAWFVTSAANVELAVTVITSITGLIFLFISLMMCFQMITKKYPEESWRMTLMMLITILIPVMTLVEFLISKAAEGTMKWNETLGEAFKYTSGLKTGVLGLWNIYTFALLILLVPLNNQK